MTTAPEYPSTYFYTLTVGTVFAMSDRLVGCRYVKTHSADQTVNGIGLARIYRDGELHGLPFPVDADQCVWEEGNIPPGR